MCVSQNKISGNFALRVLRTVYDENFEIFLSKVKSEKLTSTMVDFLATKQVSAPSPRFDLALCVGAPATHNTWTTAVARTDVYV